MNVLRLPILLVLFLGTFLRFYRIDNQSLWYDEGNSARMTERTASQVIAAAASDIHPPGYYLTLSGWSALLGRSELALRSLSAMAGIILISIIYHLGYRYFSTNAGLLAALFSAIHPALIYYSQEARMYMMASTLGAAIFALTLQMYSVTAPRHGVPGVHKPYGSKTSISMFVPRLVRHQNLIAPYILISAMGLYTHYSFPFVLIAANLTVFWHVLQHRQYLKYFLTSWLPIQVGGLLLFLPWLPTAIHHLTTWPADRQHLPWHQTVPALWGWLALGPTIHTDTMITSLGVFALLTLIGLLYRYSLPFAIWLLLPSGLTLVLGLFSESFAKFLLLAVPPVTLLIAGGIITLWEGRSRPITIALARSSAIILTVSALWLNLMALANLYNNPDYSRDDYRSIAADLSTVHRTGDAILLNAPNQWEVFTYYYPDDPHVIPLARSRPLDAKEQIEDLVSITSRYQRLFVIFWGEKQSDPDQVIEHWLSDNTFKAEDRWYGAVRVSTYSTPQNMTRIQRRVSTRFGESIVLKDYTLNSATFNPGDILQISLVWTSDFQLLDRYKVFVHVYDDTESPPISQHDSEPGGGLKSTYKWEVGETVIDKHGVKLPANLTPGEYQLAVGMYNLETGDRLRTIQNNELEGDRLILGTITVRSQTQ